MIIVLDNYDSFTYNLVHYIGELKKDLKQVLVDLKKEGKSIFGYGAPAKGNVLLNYCDIDNSILEFIIDTTPIKQGKFTPGTHIPIVSPSNIMKKGVGGELASKLDWLCIPHPS